MEHYIVLKDGQTAAFVRVPEYDKFVRVAGLLIDEGFHIQRVTAARYEDEERAFDYWETQTRIKK